MRARRVLSSLVASVWVVGAIPSHALAQDAEVAPVSAPIVGQSYMDQLPPWLLEQVRQAESLAAAGDLEAAEGTLEAADRQASELLPDEDPRWAILLLARGRLRTDQGRFAEALTDLGQAERRLGEAPLDTLLQGTLLYDTARVHDALGQHELTEAYARRALQVRRAALGPVSVPAADATNLLANSLAAQGLYVDAEVSYRQVLGIMEVLKGPHDASLAGPLTNLANSLRRSGRGANADALYRRALNIAEASGDRILLAQCLTNYGWYLHLQGRGTEAEPLFQRALTLAMDLVGADHPFTGIAQANLGFSLSDQGRWAEAEVPFRQGLAVLEQGIGSDSPDLKETLLGLATTLAEQGQAQEAESLFRRAYRLTYTALGPAHGDTLQTSESLAGFLLRDNRPVEGLSQVRQSLGDLLGEGGRNRDWRSRTRLARPLFGRHVEAAWRVSHAHD